MKAIELLNKIASGEAPKKLKFDDIIWIYKKGINQYISEGDDYCLGGFDFDDLNDEVEVLEE